uniref:Uncharacterized protein n=1 Tax=Anguilla anguilla TaxID=7936 RepID=A0A0E9XQS4_ANGAN
MSQDSFTLQGVKWNAIFLHSGINYPGENSKHTSPCTLKVEVLFCCLRPGTSMHIFILVQLTAINQVCEVITATGGHYLSMAGTIVHWQITNFKFISCLILDEEI